MSLYEKIRMASGKVVHHGKYSYRLNEYTGDILRCPIGDENREWITHDGNIVTNWTAVKRIGKNAI